MMHSPYQRNLPVHSQFPLSLPGEPVNILIASPHEQDRTELAAIARQHNWRFREARTVREVMRELAHERVPVILCESRLPDGTWEDVVSCTATCSIRPRLIVMSRSADERLWLEVLSMGGFDVLPSPFVNKEVCRCVELAFRNWWDEVQQESWRKGPRVAVAVA